jgi:hypothetical protein
MRKRIDHILKWAAGASVCVAAGCGVDQDIILNAGLSFFSDLAVFLLQNAVAGVG